MRTRTEREDALAEIEKAANDHDVGMILALLEICRRIEEASERVAGAHDETRQAIDGLSESLNRRLRAVASGALSDDD
jgi:hypothetical protein